MPSSATVAYRWPRLLLLLAAPAAAVVGQYWLTIRIAPDRAVLGWAIGALCFLLLFLLSRDSRELPSPASPYLSLQSERLLFATVMLIGLFFVAFRIDQFPPGVNHDAAWEAMYGIRIVNGEPYIAYANEAWGRETFTFYFKAVAVWLLGPTERAIQAPSMVAGFLTLPFFYWWARNTFGSALAVLATLFLASSGWHLIFSRTGWRSDFQPFFMVLTCCFFVRGMRTTKSLDFGLAGIFLAATLNTYNASRLFPVLFLLWLPLVVLQSWKLRGFVRRYGRGLSTGILTFIIAIAPLAWFAWTNWSIFNSRAVALRGQADLWQAVQQSLLLFNYAGNGDDFFVREPGLETPAAVLFVFGLLWCLLRIRDERAQFLLLGFLLHLIPGWISRPNMNRCIGTMPFVYFFAGLGLYFLVEQARRLIPRAGAWVGVALAIAACSAAVVTTYQQYLGPQRRTVWGYYPEATIVGRYMKTLVPKYALWVGGANLPRDTITFLTYQGTGHPERRNYTWVDNISWVTRANIVPPSGKGAAFILPLVDRGPSTLSALKLRYPKHRLEDILHPTIAGRAVARAFLVEDEDIHAIAVDPALPTLPVNSQVDVQSLNLAATDAIADETPQAVEPLGSLRQPRGIALDAQGNVYVSDFGHHRVQVFDPALQPLRQWGTQGDLPGYFKEPCDVALGPDGMIYVADTWNQRIQVFSSEGKFLRQLSGTFFGPRGVTVSPDGKVYVSDTGNNRVVRFSAAGTRETEWGTRGSEAGAMSEPVGIATDTKGNVYVVDNGNGRLQTFSAEGKLVRHFAVTGWQSGAWSEPHLAIDPNGIIWVTVPLAKEVRAYDTDGNLKRRINAAEGKFQTPIGIAYDVARNEVVVSDIENRLLRIPGGV